MNLEQLYAQISEAVKQLDFDRIWKGFRPLKFALYNEKECYFDGKYIEKTALRSQNMRNYLLAENTEVKNFLMNINMKHVWKR